MSKNYSEYFLNIYRKTPNSKVKLVKLQAEGPTSLLQMYILLLLSLHYKCTLYVLVLHPSNHLHQHWMYFLSSNLMKEIDPNSEDLSTEHTTFNLYMLENGRFRS